MIKISERRLLYKDIQLVISEDSKGVVTLERNPEDGIILRLYNNNQEMKLSSQFSITSDEPFYEILRMDLEEARL